jgi:hypothetical protein
MINEDYIKESPYMLRLRKRINYAACFVLPFLALVSYNLYATEGLGIFMLVCVVCVVPNLILNLKVKRYTGYILVLMSFLLILYLNIHSAYGRELLSYFGGFRGLLLISAIMALCLLIGQYVVRIVLFIILDVLDDKRSHKINNGL